jgi:hypothetical protein
MSHGRDADVDTSVRIALAAQMASRGLEEDRSKLYWDLVETSLSEAARRALQAMNRFNYEYQSDFAKHYVAEGRRSVLTLWLTSRFGPLREDLQARIKAATSPELDAMAERLLAAQSAEEAVCSQ